MHQSLTRLLVPAPKYLVSSEKPMAGEKNAKAHTETLLAERKGSLLPGVTSLEVYQTQPAAVNRTKRNTKLTTSSLIGQSLLRA